MQWGLNSHAGMVLQLIGTPDLCTARLWPHSPEARTVNGTTLQQPIVDALYYFKRTARRPAHLSF